MSREAKVLVGILVVVVAGMIGLFALANKPTAEPVGDMTKITRETSHKEGSGSVTLVEFGDSRCPACSKAYPDVKQIMKDFDGKVTFYFRNYPLAQHPLADAAANAAEEAAAQGKFWEMHDKLYDNQTAWGDLNKNTPKADALEMWLGYAKDLGLDTEKIKSAVNDGKYDTLIQQDTADGNALNVTGTPSFFVNGKLVTTGYSYSNLRDAINAALGENK